MASEKRAFAGRVIFDHLVKAGGQAVNAWLRNALGAAIVTKNLSGNHRELIQRYGGEFSVISSHVAFFGEGLDPRYDYLTCLREPVDRTLSQLFFTVNNHEQAKLPELWRKVESLLAAHGLREGRENGDSIDSAAPISLADIPLTSNYYVNHFSSILPGEPKTDADKLGRALRAIDEYDLWGIYEEMQNFVADIAARLGIAAPQRIARVNQTARRLGVKEVPLSLRQHVEEMNALDLDFYYQMKSRYAQARTRWYREAVTASRWAPIEPTSRVAIEEEFSLVAAKRRCPLEIDTREVLVFQLDFSLDRELHDIEIGVHIHDDVGGPVFGTNTEILENTPVAGSRGLHQVFVSIPASLPVGAYTAGFTIAERVDGGTREVARYDQLLPFQVVLPAEAKATGRLDLGAVIEHRYVSDDVVRLAEHTEGRMTCLDRVETQAVDRFFKLRVQIVNESSQDWHGTEAHPLSLSYHWCDQAGNTVVFEGERTDFPGGRLAGGGMLETALLVLPPASTGRYRLVAMPVQEGYCWFDENGFVPLEVEFDVGGGV